MATIREVARRAGVAPITVSRVLNNSGYVRPETRRRVEEAAAALHYVPNMLAHSLRSNRTQTLALVLTDITNPFWTAVARAVEDEASQQGFNVIFCNTDEDEAKQQQYLAMLLRRRVDGVLLVPAGGSSETVRALRAQRVPVVVLDRKIPGVTVDLVRGDSLDGARQAVEHLLALGHRCIAVLSGPPHLSVSQERVEGYRAALQAAGQAVDERLVRFGRFTVESGQSMAAELLADLARRPTAFFAANNFIAIGALRALQAAALQVPEDVSLVAFDELPYPAFQAPALTVVAQPTYELGRTAARRLLARIAQPDLPEGEEVLLATSLQLRGSTAPPPAG